MSASVRQDLSQVWKEVKHWQNWCNSFFSRQNSEAMSQSQSLSIDFTQYMNNQSDEQYQPAYSGILSINDYEQPNQPQQELPFDQIELILSQANTITNRREIVLIMAVNYLQDRCAELTNTNNYLHLRVEDLIEESSYLNQVIINQEIAHGFLQIMHSEIESYKLQFSKYRDKELAVKRHMYEENGRLRIKIDELERDLERKQRQIEEMEEEKSQLLVDNEELSDINAQLSEKIQDLQEELRAKNESMYNHRGYGRRMEDSIQAELQTMIEKLMQQLEDQRELKFNLSGQYKNLQKQVLLLQKELTQKNSKIYQLQMNTIRSNRLASPNSNKNGHNKHYETSYNAKKTQQVPKRNGNASYNYRQSQSFRTFSLMTLLNQDAQFNRKIRMIIALKVIEFYLRKINKRDFTTQMLENLLVYNYSSIYPQACIIRKDRNCTSKEGECSLERLIWNLGFILDNLINQGQEQSQPRSPSQLQLASLINSILEQNSCTLRDVEQLKQLVQQSI